MEALNRITRNDHSFLSIGMLVVTLIALFFSLNNTFQLNTETAYQTYSFIIGVISLFCFSLHLFSTLRNVTKVNTFQSKKMLVFRLILTSFMIIWSLLMVFSEGAISVNEVLFAWLSFITFEIFQVLRLGNKTIANEQYLANDFPMKKTVVILLIFFVAEIITYHLILGLPTLYPMYFVYLSLFLIIISTPVVFACLALRELILMRKRR